MIISYSICIYVCVLLSAELNRKNGCIVCACVCVYICMYACVCMYVCMYICTCVCMYVCMYVAIISRKDVDRKEEEGS